MSSKSDKKIGIKKIKNQKPTIPRLTPSIRMEQPHLLVSPLNYPTFYFSKKRVSPLKPFKSLDKRRQIYPNNVAPSEGDIKFGGKFESGNLDRVYRRGNNSYEIHIAPDPKRTAQWFYFSAENIKPGTYTFVIIGFHRDTGIHHHGVTPVALSENDKRIGIGWKRIGEQLNYWLSSSGKPREYTMSFQFTVHKLDSMHFAYTYPYNYSDLQSFLRTLPSYVHITRNIFSPGKLNIPMIFWDADNQISSQLPEDPNQIPGGRKPLAIIVARHHPGETCSSYAMEGFLQKFFNKSDKEANEMRNEYSFLIIPMVNVDGVVCGFYRPGLNGIDYNRVWKTKSKTELGSSILDIIDSLTKTRKLVFFLDFHGHAGLWNAFTYTLTNDKVPLSELSPVFPETMSKVCQYFTATHSYILSPHAYDRTMRVALHHRYKVPFAYTLEMSIGGSTLTKEPNMFTPNEYRIVGSSTLTAMYEMLLLNENIKGKLDFKATEIDENVEIKHEKKKHHHHGKKHHSTNNSDYEYNDIDE
ncbi:Clan MC, family M14, Zinc carboxypeptidase-like metallopeptidase [Trichomonas vaginalis G3]|uniref:Clan MC, family M14, Zinc carboxypeptidase-like metallopeptidase n=1 Tax=Trichomonas vaginalis (strain ATCC PRA-98 / G3) TaxID=412133 RepID=A2F1U3_TRIV3|nr:protein deglutamylation [Trichomonas vaginalis G3]EAY01143.1 Clan MC, family M14, Zinc carboxypeptidase-like metallopeptidase [Trichomonas vaginalis G3]KAI5540518.1 protein deglutamylation [Trichomonas vaginalis G3]|eukprot:XP_001313995.1 Clan MC, family M14, Zinc carboxypeptidase-like metallopeptidase [Trichomonas vaginalis G3]